MKNRNIIKKENNSSIMNYEEMVFKSREEKDKFFRNHPYSPLTTEQKRKFKGLNYFEPNISYRYEVKINKYEDQRKVSIRTSKGTAKEYIRWGYIEFERDSKTNILSVFKQEGEDYFFIPFKDKTTGKETYSAGRYIEVENLGDDLYLLDFNFAYNPYCAYNDNWVCPLTPFENNLEIAIEAGEKKFHD
ncbi:hypothetical protein DRN69_06365 [Candidatus Pacearchaeota archaeon]|nr:MAG: hypothetical protein DRN69_06365 [Candidatus Pacearchaeota archaeon]